MSSEGATNALQQFEAFGAAIEGHVPPKHEGNIMEEEVCLRVPVRYRIRVRGSDMQFEAVGRFAGFDVPADAAPEVLILEFVSEHSYNDENETEDAEGE